jgi:hypothetical protein
VSDLNKIISDTNGMRKKILKDLQEYMSIYSSLEKEVQNRFQDEFKHNNHKIAGLEDFHQLSYTCKKNLSTVKTTLNLIAKMSDLSSFDINEEAQLVKELDKLLKD